MSALLFLIKVPNEVGLSFDKKSETEEYNCKETNESTNINNTNNCENNAKRVENDYDMLVNRPISGDKCQDIVTNGQRNKLTSEEEPNNTLDGGCGSESVANGTHPLLDENEQITDNLVLCKDGNAQEKELEICSENVAVSFTNDGAIDTPGMADFIPKEPEMHLSEAVLDILESFSIDNVLQTLSKDEKSFQISFVDEGSHLRCESILDKLAEKGVGLKPGTSVSLFPANLHKAATEVETDNLQKSLGNTVLSEQKEHSFRESIKSRMLVDQVVFSVRKNAEFSFDYLLLMILASLVAAVGLVENSSVILVASMLISPLMGPILAGTFGTVIGNTSLRNLGIKSELIGLGLCLLNGLLFGIVTGGIGLGGAIWGSTDEWPTYEMKSRGLSRSLWIGALVAIPSGAGVALSVLSNYAGSLVGVAISASLLPPAVNAGMLWSYAVLSIISPPTVISDDQTLSVATISNATTPQVLGNTTSSSTVQQSKVIDCPALVNNNYRYVYSCDMATDTAILGLVSLSLTLLNITFIFIMGIIFLKIKEFNTGKHGSEAADDSDTEFWGKDLKVARDSYKTAKGANSISLARSFLQEWQKLNQQDHEEKDQKPLRTLHFKQILQEVENSHGVHSLLQRLPFWNHTRPLSQELDTEFQKAQYDLQQIYFAQYDNYQSYRPQVAASLPSVHYTFHGRSSHVMSPIFSPTIFLPRRRSYTISETARPETATMSTIEEKTPAADMKLKITSELYQRRKHDPKRKRFKVFKVCEGSVEKKREEKQKPSVVTDPLL